MSILEKLSFRSAKKVKQAPPETETQTQQPVAVSMSLTQKAGGTQGEAEVQGATDEVAAVLITVISQYTELPLEQIKIKSIKKIA